MSSQIHSYNKRNKNNLRQIFLRLGKSRNYFNYYSTKFYNTLPEDIRNLAYVQKTIKEIILKNPMYNITARMNYIKL